MPTYEYRCTKCGTLFEVVKKITARPGSRCPKCGGKAERQLSGGAGLVFKGPGFYLTDYGRAGQRKPEADGHAEQPKPETSKQETSKPDAPAKPGPGRSQKKKDQG
jgi:putative FmdB family regulatory protein